MTPPPPKPLIIADATEHCARQSCIQPRGGPLRCMCRFVPGPEYPLPGHGIELWEVAKGGGAHGWASDHCPHWMGGQCSEDEHGLAASHGCPLPPFTCPLVGYSVGSERCGWFEEHLLEDAPEAVQEDYDRRTGPPSNGAFRPEGVCVLAHDPPQRCIYLERQMEEDGNHAR